MKGGEGGGARGREQPRVGTSEQGTACISPRGRRGSQGHRTGKSWKMAPSAARVAGIASAACTRVSTRPSFFSGQSGTMGRVQ